MCSSKRAWSVFSNSARSLAGSSLDAPARFIGVWFVNARNREREQARSVPQERGGAIEISVGSTGAAFRVREGTNRGAEVITRANTLLLQRPQTAEIRPLKTNLRPSDTNV